jgi:hypothetical protein
MKIIPFLTKIVVAPHGITDIGHSLKTNNSIDLLKIYGINFTFTNIINNFDFSNNIVNIYLILTTIAHFRHDFSFINIDINQIKIPRYLYSTLALIIFNYINQELIYYYMLFIHVPNHFRLNNFHIKEFKSLNFFLYFLIGFICLKIDVDFILNNQNILNYIKSILISHILYQEYYVLNKNIDY